MICSYEPLTYNDNSFHVNVQFILFLDNQWIGELLGFMGTTSGPYWTALERRRRWHRCMMAKLTHVFATAFLRGRALQHQAIKDDMYSELNVDDPT